MPTSSEFTKTLTFFCFVPRVDKLPNKKTKKRKLQEEDNSKKAKTQKIQRNSGVWEIDEIDDQEESFTADETISNDWTLESTNEKPTKSKKIKKSAKKSKSVELNCDVSMNDEVFEENSTPKKVKVEKSSPKKKVSPKKLTKKSETEIIIPMNGNDVFSTPKSLRKNMSTPKSVVKNPFSTPVSSSKKVKIALDLNRSQEHSEYHQSIVSSPGIPFDADKKPTKPLLKKSRMPIITINPFYRR